MPSQEKNGSWSHFFSPSYDNEEKKSWWFKKRRRVYVVFTAKNDTISEDMKSLFHSTFNFSKAKKKRSHDQR